MKRTTKILLIVFALPVLVIVASGMDGFALRHGRFRFQSTRDSSIFQMMKNDARQVSAAASQYFIENSVSEVSAQNIGPYLSQSRLCGENELKADGGVFSGPRLSMESGTLRKGGTFVIRCEKFEPGDLADRYRYDYEKLLISVEGEHAMRFFVDTGELAPAQR